MEDGLKKQKSVINNEKGSVIILAVLILAVLTILGVSSINTSTVELQIVRNERIYQQNFYAADSAAMEAAQKVELATSDELDDRDFNTFVWLKKKGDIPDMSDIASWDVLNSDDSNLDNADLSVQEVGIAGGSSLDATAVSNLYKYDVWGYGVSNSGGQALIRIGYKKRH